MTEEDMAWSVAEEAHAAAIRAQAETLLPEAREHGLSLQVYLAPTHAAEILEAVRDGQFASPEEAIFVLLGEMLEMRPHVDLRKEALRRSLEAAMEGPFLSSEEVIESLRASQKSWREPLVWQRVRMAAPEAAVECRKVESSARGSGSDPDAGESEL